MSFDITDRVYLEDSDLGDPMTQQHRDKPLYVGHHIAFPAYAMSMVITNFRFSIWLRNASLAGLYIKNMMFGSHRCAFKKFMSICGLQKIYDDVQFNKKKKFNEL